jgi:adenylyltransferase/sulfurtransferase
LVLKTISPKELVNWIAEGNLQLIDVREPHEAEICSIGGLLIPMNDIPNEWKAIDREKNVVIYCRSGVRSANVIQFLEHYHQFSNLYNLEGGILAWIADVDSSLQPY